MSNEKKTGSVFKFATIVCLVCSLIVSVAAVSLRGIQQQNANNEMKVNILRAAGLAGIDEKLSTDAIEERFQEIIPVAVDFETGDIAKDIDPLKYDMYAVADSSEGKVLKEDPANIKRIAPIGTAYVLAEGDKVERLIVPIQGYGLWSTMYGFIALAFPDHEAEIVGLTFYQHAETAGLGSRITEPAWQQKFVGLKPYNAQGVPRIDIVKSGAEGSDYKVDAIAGATLTSNGVEYMINFWLGNQAYQKFIEKIADGELNMAALKNNQNDVK